MPKRAMSYREPTMAIISIAQQERPNWSGHIDFVCDQATAFSSVVSISFSSSSSAPSSRSKTPGPFAGHSSALGLEAEVAEALHRHSSAPFRQM